MSTSDPTLPSSASPPTLSGAQGERWMPGMTYHDLQPSSLHVLFLLRVLPPARSHDSLNPALAPWIVLLSLPVLRLMQSIQRGWWVSAGCAALTLAGVLLLVLLHERARRREAWLVSLSSSTSDIHPAMALAVSNAAYLGLGIACALLWYVEDAQLSDPLLAAIPPVIILVLVLVWWRCYRATERRLAPAYRHGTTTIDPQP